MKSLSFPRSWSRFCLLICLLAPLGRAEDSEARLSRAILALMDADQRLSENQRPAALALYQDAWSHLKALQENDPEFKTRIVEFRLAYVGEKLAELQPEGGAAAPAPRAPQAVNYEQLYLETRAQALRDSQRLLEVEKRQMDAQLTLREREQSLAETRNELTELRRRLDTVQTESDNELREARTELSNLRRFNNLLQERATTMEEQNGRLTAELAESRENEALKQMQIRELEANIAEQRQAAEQAATQAADEIQALQNSLLERGRESRQRQERIEELENQIAESQERLASLQLLEDTVIELNRRLNARDTAFAELETQLERIPELEGKMAENEAATREATEALAPAKEALAELTIRYQSLQQERETAELEARETMVDLVRQLNAALNESTVTRRQLDAARARIDELEQPAVDEDAPVEPPPEAGEPEADEA